MNYDEAVEKPAKQRFFTPLFQLAIFSIYLAIYPTANKGLITSAKFVQIDLSTHADLHNVDDDKY